MLLLLFYFAGLGHLRLVFMSQFVIKETFLKGCFKELEKT